jgi:hypothetical protein
MILNAGKNETFGRGSLSCESVIRGREQFFLFFCRQIFPSNLMPRLVRPFYPRGTQFPRRR